ncbi:MAG: MaoP family protein [Saccharospirillum sp.]
MTATISPEGFTQGKPFTDNRNYPYGIERSGDYSIREAQTLRRLGETFRRLETGDLQPTNEVETQFVKMIKGEKEASSDCEKLWLKYRANVEGKSRATFSFTSSYYYAKGSQTAISDEDFSADYGD